MSEGVSEVSSASERGSAAEGTSTASSPEQANEWAVRANEQTDEQVTQYLRLYSCLFQTTVQRATVKMTALTKPQQCQKFECETLAIIFFLPRAEQIKWLEEPTKFILTQDWLIRSFRIEKKEGNKMLEKNDQIEHKKENCHLKFFETVRYSWSVAIVLDASRHNFMTKEQCSTTYSMKM